MKHLVTGCSGYLGSKFISRLVELNKDYLCLGRFGSASTSKVNSDNFLLTSSNIFDLQNFIRKWSDNEPVTVIHFASKFTPKHDSSDVSDLIDSNVKYGTQILESISGLSKKRFINICSAWQSHSFYPDLFTLYGSSKRAFLEILEFYKQDSNVDFSNIYLFDNYGEEDSRRKIVQLLIEAAINGNTLDLRSKDQIINLLHVDDVLTAILRILEFENKHENFIVQSKDFISVGELSNEIAKIHGEGLSLNWGTSDGRLISAEKIDSPGMSPPNWTQEIPLNAGLKRVYDNAIRKL
jgi:CDP-paratose synthetase